MVGVVVTWTIAFFAANLLQCLPISESWSLNPAPGTCINSTMMYLGQGWSDIFTDVVILSMPLPWVCELVIRLNTTVAANLNQIWKLQMAPMRKFFVILMFQLGAL